MVDLSVIMPCRNVGSTIGDQLDALLAQTWAGDWEIVVVENRSTDDTAEVLAAYARRDRRVRVVPCYEDRGIPPVRNAGIEASRGAHLAFCDGDDVVGSRWVSAMAAGLAEHEYVTGPLELVKLNSPAAIASRPALDDRPGTFGDTVRFAHSCNLGIRRQVFERLGPFDPRFNASGEDIELGIRIARAGVGLHYCPSALVHYRLRGSAGAIWHQARRNGRFYPLVAREARRSGFPISRLRGAKYWPWLALRAGTLGTPGGRARWCFVAGSAVGRLEGSLRYATISL